MRARSCMQGTVAWALALAVSADTLIVDDDAGPGVDFTDIQTAVDAAGNGDVLIVQDGAYAGFTIQGKRLAVVGRGAVGVQGLVAIRNQGTKRCELSSLSMPGLRLENCAGAIFLDALTIEELFGTPAPAPELLYIDQCADVRMRASAVVGAYDFFGLTGTDGIVVQNSRLELSSSYATGTSGTEGGAARDAGDGGCGAMLINSRAHFADSQLVGNSGGEVPCSGGCNDAGNGGNGLTVDATSEAIVVGGPNAFLAGGDLGSKACCVGTGSSGFALSNQGYVRKSGLGPPTSFPNSTTKQTNSGTIDTPVPDDPWLEVLGTPANGSFDTVLRIWGPPGHAVRINLGRTPLQIKTPGIEVEILVAKLRTINLGTMPATGYIDYAWPQLGFFPTGTPFIAQSITVLPTGEVRRTNSAPIIVR